jgi:hypothetical protein
MRRQWALKSGLATALADVQRWRNERLAELDDHIVYEGGDWSAIVPLPALSGRVVRRGEMVKCYGYSSSLPGDRKHEYVKTRCNHSFTGD